MLPDDDLILSDIETSIALEQVNIETKEKQEIVDNQDNTLVICFADDCSEQNTKNCRKCNRPFCIIHCNTFSPNFCKDCFKDISIVAEKFKRTFGHVAQNGQLYSSTEERTRYYMDGIDWPFVTPWIHTLTDDELKSIWVFHHFIMRLIETENETRRIEYNRKIRENTPSTRLITGVQKTATRTIKTVKAVDTIDDVRKKLRKQGIAENLIDMMVAAMKKD